MCNRIGIITNKPSSYFPLCKHLLCGSWAKVFATRGWKPLKSARHSPNGDILAGGFSDIRSNYRIAHVRRAPYWTAISFGTRGYEAAAIRRSSKRIPSTRWTEEERKTREADGFLQRFNEPEIIHRGPRKPKRNTALTLEIGGGKNCKHRLHGT